MSSRKKLGGSSNALASRTSRNKDVSMSFQIPADLSSEEFLLDSDPREFLEDVAPTPGPSRLTLRAPPSPDEATPKAAHRVFAPISRMQHESDTVTSAQEVVIAGKFHSPPQNSDSDGSPVDATPRPTLRSVTNKASGIVPEYSPVKERLDSIGSALHALESEAPLAGSLVDQGKEKVRKPIRRKASHGQPTLPKKLVPVEGGIVKKAKAKSTAKVTRRLPQAAPPPELSEMPVIAFDIAHMYESTPRAIGLMAPPPGYEHLVLDNAPNPVQHPNSEIATQLDPDLLMSRTEAPSSVSSLVSPKRSDLLTISQLSPSKQTIHVTHHQPTEIPPIPLPHSSLGKRPTSATSCDEQDQPQERPPKRPKASTSTLNPAVPSDSELRRSRSTRLKPDSTTASRRAQIVSRGRVAIQNQPDTRAKPLRNASSSTTSRTSGKKLSSSSGSAASRSSLRPSERLASSDGNIGIGARPSRSSRLDIKTSTAEDTRKNPEKVPAKAQSKKQTQQGHTLSTSELDKENERGTFPLINATRPVEFKFRSEARSEARKSGSGHGHDIEGSTTGGSKRRSVSIPDYKVIHAQDEARRSQRKAPVAPTIPRPFNLHTEDRVRERHAFDEHIREKEREMEIVMEQKRREQEEEDEREIRELRRKAIPKAHVVPDWYKDAPKRKTRSQEAT